MTFLIGLIICAVHVAVPGRRDATKAASEPIAKRSQSGATPPGNVVIEITSGDGALARATSPINSLAPSLFTANASGAGAPAAIATKDGVNFYPAAGADGQPAPLDAGDYLILFGTGFRRAAKETVKITIGGKEAPVLFVGAQSAFAGLDRLNTQLPIGTSGIVEVVLTISGRTANNVEVRVK